MQKREEVSMTASRNLVGSWKVLSFWIEFENSEDRDEPFGANPDGYVVLTETRLTAVITGPNRKTGQSTDQLFETMMAYSGRYRLQGDDCFVTTVDKVGGTRSNRRD
jgi:hypothetical protein